MDEVVITLPDGSERRVPRGTPLSQVVAGIGRRLAKDAVAVELDGQIVELFRPLERGGRLRVLTFADESGRRCYRHTAAHILAQAVKRVFPGARLGIGPALDDGFYYDIDAGRPLTDEDLARLEDEMRRIIAEDHPLERFELPREEAVRLMEERGEPFKVELIQQIPEGEPISFYRQGEFVDLCRGPHAPRTGRIRAVKLLSVAGAYWKGDERGPVLQRVYGTAFDSEEELRQFLWRREEARRRDHRRLGPELDLFHFDEIAPGYAFWHPKGTVLFNELVALSRELQEPMGYQEVRTPDILRVDLWKRSGHWDLYRDNMFVVPGEDEGEAYGVKPMNCPGHCLIYASRVRSYRDLPLRLAEYGHLSRFERSGTLHGLLRVRGMTQDDAHLFVREDQIGEEMARVLGLIDRIYRDIFRLEYDVELATRPERFLGDPATWDRAEAELARLLEASGRPYRINPGEGAFYGPKLEFYLYDSLGRRWQCATVQLDFQLPQRFDLKYTGPDGQEHRPVMIHRAIMGTLERFIGILVEHYGGAFPTWLAPVQVKVLPVSDGQREYARSVRQRLAAAGVRVEVDERDEKLGYKIRAAQLEKVPYMLVVGEREREQGLVAVRNRELGDCGALPLEQFAAALVEEIGARRDRPRVGAPAAEA